MSQISEIYKLYLEHNSVQTDSRKIKEGDLFFALKGEHFNGNEYALQALEQGAIAAVVDDWELSKKSDKLFFADEGSLTCLQQLARYHRLQFRIPFIAITGSNGKTTTKELVHAVLSKEFKTSATKGNLNNHIGIPLTILDIKKGTEIAIIEMGANHQKEIDFYCRIVLPNYALITNCGKAHLEGFGGVEGVRKGKGELYDFIRKSEGTIFRNADYAYLEEMAHDIPEQITYGTGNAKIMGKPILDGHFVDVALLTSGMETTLHSHLAGEYNVANILAAVAVGNYFGVKLEDIKSAVESYEPDNSRSQWIEKDSNKIILDAYNANPSSMTAALQNLAEIDEPNKWLLLGGMKELGIYSEDEHKGIVQLAQKLGFKNVLLCGPEFESVKENYSWFANAQDLEKWLVAHPIQNAVVLIKGSRSTGMEAVLPAFN